MPDDKPPQITLTVFLIKEDRVDLDSFLPDNESLDKYTIKNGRETIGDLYIKLSRENLLDGASSSRTILTQRI